MRKAMTRGLLVAAFAIGGIAMAGTAGARPAHDTAKHPDGYTFLGISSGYQDCVELGEDGLKQGSWHAYYCEDTPPTANMWIVY